MDLLADEGDGYPTAKAMETPSRLRISTSEIADAYDADFPDSGKVLIKGYGNTPSPTGSPEVLTLEIPLPTPASPFTTTEVFSRVLSVQKPRTIGDVTLSAIDASTQEVTVLGIYEPSETQPFYHRYKISSYDPEVGVRGLCKRRFVPLEGEDNELVTPSNMGALKLGMLAVNYENKNDLERANDYWNRAMMTLNLEMREARGGAQMMGQIDPSAFQIRRLKNHW